MLVVVYLFLLSALRAGLEFGSATLGDSRGGQTIRIRSLVPGAQWMGKTIDLLVTVTKCVVVVLGSL